MVVCWLLLLCVERCCGCVVCRSLCVAVLCAACYVMSSVVCCVLSVGARW